MARSQTLARRYGFKLISNLASVPVYLVMEALLPRALGPQMYGNYSFATNFFQQLSGFLDMGTSTCFYNALSRRPHQIALVVFYARICIVIALLFLLGSLLCLWAPLGNLAMPGLPLWLVPLSAAWAYFTWIGRVLRSMNDAYGETALSEIWRTLISLGGIVILCLLFWGGWLNISTLFLQQYLVLLGTAAAFALVCSSYFKKNRERFSFSLPRGEGKILGREFLDYSHPLFVQALLSFFMLTSERWLLQWFDGSAQQGFYALSQKVGMACFLFVSAMTPLLMRELSIAWGKHDLEQMGSLLTRFAPLLYALAAYFSCFTLVEATPIVEIFGGKEFMAAITPVQIMSLYPLHQAYGQMASSVFHATGRTKILRNITACECLYGLALAWLMLAPARYAGLNLGASGLAIKTVSVQIITVNLYLWIASRQIPFNFWRNVLHQFVCVAVMAALALVSRELSLLVIFHATPDFFIWRFLCSGFIYTALVFALWIVAPQMLGLSRQELRELRVRFCRFARLVK